MSELMHPYLQSLKIDGKEINLSTVEVFTYMEAADLSGPSIILSLLDEYSIIRDDVGLKAGSEVTCELASFLDDTVEAFTETFTVAVHPINNGVITIEAMQKDCFELKQPAGKPQFFVNKTPEDILKALLPTLDVDCQASSEVTYHLNSGTLPTMLIRQMARDHGAACWIARGTVYFVPYKKLAGQSGYLKYGKNSPDADVEIYGSSVINNQSHYERTTQKHWMSQSLDKGLITASEYADKEIVMLPQMGQSQLDNQSVYLQPKLDIELLGRGELMPTMALDVEFVKFNSNSEVDESIESTLIVHHVSHYQRGKHYLTRAILGVVNNGE